jgi:putative oxidoreductase
MSTPSFARALPAVARYLLGVIFTVFGLNFFLHFLPTPPLAGPAGSFVAALVASGYVMTLVKIVEVGAGVLLLANRFVPLALTLLAPIVVNIVAFHAFLAPSGIALALVVLLLEVYLAWSRRDAFAPLLRARPASAATAHAADLRARPVAD